MLQRFLIIAALLATNVLQAGDISKGFLTNLWRLYPSWAQTQGYHQYDTLLAPPTDKHRKLERAFCAAYLDSLSHVSPDNNTISRIEMRLVLNYCHKSLWEIDTLREWSWNPSLYNIGEGISLALGDRNTSLDNRLRTISKKLRYVKAYYFAATESIKNPTPDHTRLAIQQNLGTLSLINNALKDSVNRSSLMPTESKALLEQATLAAEYVDQYVVFLNGLMNTGKANRSFAIGRDLYNRKFYFEFQSAFTPEQVYAAALAKKAILHRDMAARASQLWPLLFYNQSFPSDTLTLIRRVLDTLTNRHAATGTFLTSIEKQLPQLSDFVKRKDLLYLDPTKPLRVRQTPEYLQGFSVASINAPGPYDKFATTYYNVDPLDKYTPAQAESFLREYNNYTLQIINIHEAIPGHYVQLMYSNRSSSILTAVLSANNTVEGWAVYAERMMLEEGYGDNDPALWLMYDKWHLRSVCNTILDYSLQVKGMSKEAALDLMEREGFQQKTEAEGKYRRATLSQVQLCAYFTGFTEIYTLRQTAQTKKGYTLRGFHEALLGLGSPPISYITDEVFSVK